jgi:hypothetical protein
MFNAVAPDTMVQLKHIYIDYCHNAALVASFVFRNMQLCRRSNHRRLNTTFGLFVTNLYEVPLVDSASFGNTTLLFVFKQI